MLFFVFVNYDNPIYLSFCNNYIKYILAYCVKAGFIFSFSSLRFVNKQALLDAELPLLPSEFESLVKKQCWEAHEVLRKK